jgi:hypothetical protein
MPTTDPEWALPALRLWSTPMRDRACQPQRSNKPRAQLREAEPRGRSRPPAVRYLTYSLLVWTPGYPCPNNSPSRPRKAVSIRNASISL